MEHFSIVVDSTVDRENIHRANSASDFTCVLSDDLHFNGNEKWVVGLVEIVIPNTINNVGDDQLLTWKKDLHSQRGIRRVSVKQKIPANTYNPVNFCRTLTRLLTDDIERKIRSRFRFDGGINRIIYHKKRNEAIELDESIWVKMGVNPSRRDLQRIDNFKNTTIVGSNPPNFNSELELGFVYTDIVKYSQVGNICAPIMRVIHLNPIIESGSNRRTGQIGEVIKFKRVHFYPLNKSTIREIKVAIRDKSGNQLRFMTGNTMLKLKFVRIS